MVDNLKMDINDVWIEDLRPKKLDDIIGNSGAIKVLKAHVASGNIQHYLFSGSPGIGKTTVALCIAYAIWGDGYRGHFAEINSSNDNGIDVVRNEIKKIAMQSNSKIIFLDEFDAVTIPAQDALRRTIEKYSSTARFVLSCNYKNKIIDPIISRMTCLHFLPLNREEMNQLIDKVCVTKNIRVPQDVREILFKYADGDARRIINPLQAASILSPDITADIIQILAQVPDVETAKLIIMQAVGGDFTSAKEMMSSMFIQKGFDYDLICKTLLEASDKIAESQMPFSNDKNRNNQILMSIHNSVAEHSHFMSRSNAIIEFSGILAKIVSINNKITLDQMKV